MIQTLRSEKSLFHSKELASFENTDQRQEPKLFCYGNLRWLACTWAGVDKITQQVSSLLHTKELLMPQRNRELSELVLTRMSGVFGQSMAEYVVHFIISREVF